MDDDMGNYYAAMKEHSREKKLSNKETAKQLFELHKVDYETKNNGMMWIVNSKEHGTVIYYPTTGLYSVKNIKKGRGVFNLLKFIGIQAR